MRAETFTIHLDYEAPRLGSGRRVVTAQVGRKWAHVRRGKRRAKLPRDLWDRVVVDKAGGGDSG